VPVIIFYYSLPKIFVSVDDKMKKNAEQKMRENGGGEEKLLDILLH